MTAQKGGYKPEQQRKKALERLEQGLFLQAVWILEELLEKYPDSLSDRYLLALACAKSDQIPEAEKELRRIIDSDPGHADAIRLLAKVCLKSEKPHQAIPLLKLYANLRPYDPTIADDLFHCHIKLNDLEKAYTTWFELSEAVAGADTTVEFLKIAFRLRKFQTLQSVYLKSREKISTAVQNNEIDPQSLYHARTYYALALHGLGLNKDAEDIFCELRRDFINKEGFVKAWQKISDFTGNPHHTEFALNGALKTWPASRKALLNLLEFYLQTDPQRCLEELEKYDENADLLKLRAKVWRKSGKIEASTEILEKLFLKDPSDSSLPFEIGVNYFSAGQKNKALKYFEYYREHQILPPELNYYLAACYFQAQRNSIGLRHLLSALEEEPASIKAWLMFTEMVLTGLETPELPALLDKAESVFQSNITGLSRLAEIHKQNNPELCLNLHEKILEIEPNNFNSGFYAAMYYLKIQQYRRACHYFAAIQDKLDPKQLSIFCEAAEKSLDYASAFGLYLKLGTEKNNLSRILEPAGKLLQKKEPFYDIFVRYGNLNAVEQNPLLVEFPLFYYKTALRHYAQKQPQKALQLLQQLEKNTPDYRRTRFFLGFINLCAGHKEEALKWLEKALTGQEKKKNQILFLLSELYMENACHEKARRCLIRLFRNNFRREDILPHLFTVYNNAGQPENFLKLLCEFSPESLQKPSVIMLFAEAFYQAGDAEKALLYFRQIPTHSSYGVQSVFRTAQCLLQLNRKVEALEQFESLKNNETKPEGYHYFAGLNYFLLHRLKSAVKHLDLSCELNEYTVESLSRLVECALLNQNIDNAVHYYLRLSALCFAPESLKRLCASKLLSPEKLIEMIHPALDKLIDNFPENDCQQILSNYIQALCKASQAEKAAAVLEYMLEKKPEYLELLARKNGKDINIFLPLLRLGEKIQPQNSFFNLNLARLYFEQGMSKEALEYYQKAKQLFTENAPDMTEKLIFHRNCAALYFRNNQLPEARNHIEKALDIAPSDTDLLAKLSYLCYKQNDLKGRSLADQRLFFIKPDDPAVSFRLLEWYLGLNDQQNAIIHLKNYLKFYPEDREKISLLAKLSAQCNMFSQEIQAYEMLEKLPGKMERDHFLKKGNAWLSLGKELKAAPCFQQYISENPENTGLRFQLARIYKKQQLWEKARFTLLEILKIEPFNATVQFELCEVLFTEKKYDAAAEQLSKLLRNKPYHTEAHYLLARICYEKGDYRQAVSSLDKVMENENNHEQARSLLARIFKSEGLWPEATREFETLYARTKKPEYLMELGVLHIKSGRRESALKNFRAICKSEPNNSKLSRLAEQFLKCSNR